MIYVKIAPLQESNAVKTGSISLKTIKSLIMTPIDFNQRLHRKPFRPFRIFLNEGFQHRSTERKTIDVTQPENVLVGLQSAVVPVEAYVDESGFRIVRRWKTVEFSNVMKLLEID